MPAATAETAGWGGWEDFENRRNALRRANPILLSWRPTTLLDLSLLGGLIVRRLASVAMTQTTQDESDLITALRAGDEAAFAQLVDSYTPALLRVARSYVPSHEIAEEVVQETWIALLKGVAGFEGRSSLRTWLFAVMINIAKARGASERRRADPATAFGGRTVDPARFRPACDRWPGHWRENELPVPFPETPEGSVLGEELIAVARRALDALPQRQKTVVTLRDMLGFDSGEVCTLLDISMANQRVLLHRGRAAVRQALEEYLSEDRQGQGERHGLQ